MTATLHVGAVPIESVRCPSWCAISQAEHLADLPAWEGRVIHWSAETAGDGWSVRHSDCTFSNGAPDPTDPAQVNIEAPTEGMPPMAALRFAEAIRAAALRALEGVQA